MIATTAQITALRSEVFVWVEQLSEAVLAQRLDTITRLNKLEAAADRGVQSLRPGTAVSYRPGRKVLWSGRVIPLPVGARTHGNSGDPLVWVMRDSDSAIRGCYAHNLVRR